MHQPHRPVPSAERGGDPWRPPTGDPSRPATADPWGPPGGPSGAGSTGAGWGLVVGVLAVLAAGAALFGGSAPGIGWHDRYAALTEEVADGLPRVGEPEASGNAMCFDVCRQVASTYAVSDPAPVLAERLRLRMEELGMTDVSAECPPEYTTCHAQGRQDDLWVRSTQETRPEWAGELHVLVQESVGVPG